MSKRYVYKPLLFIAILGVLWILANQAFHTLVESNDIFFTQWEKLEVSNDINTVVLGDSHVMFGVDQPNLPDSVFNFAYAGDQFEDMHLKARYLLSKRPDIEYYLIQYDAHNFFTGGTSNGDPRYLSFVADSIYRNNFELELLSFGLQKLRHWLPLASGKNRRNFEQVLMKDLQEVTLDRSWHPGFYYNKNGHVVWEYHGQSLASNPDSVIQKLARRKAYDLHRLDKNPIPQAIEQFKSMIAQLKQSGKKVVLFTMPVSTPYRELREQTTTSFISSLKPNLPMVKLDTLFRNRIQYFSDPSHLNKKGEQMFTPVFNKKVLSAGN
jgi:hypothetical protein